MEDWVNMKAIICVGVSASGKSTFARKCCDEIYRPGFDFTVTTPHRVEFNRDTVRQYLIEADGKEWKWSNWKWKREGEVTGIINRGIEDAAALRKDIIVSDTNLHAGRRNTLVAWLKSLGYEVEIMDFPVTLEEAWERDSARHNGVGHSVIASQYENWLEYIGRKDSYAEHRAVFVANSNERPLCILVDIDGTLAHMNGKRGAFDWDKVGLDDVDDAVKMIVNAWKMMNSGEVIVLSGRDGVCREETEKWLKDNEIGYNQLIMRAPNDMRKDTIVKEEIFWRDIADNYNVQFVIDDRPCVVRLWQRIGLKTFAVGNQHIEF